MTFEGDTDNDFDERGFGVTRPAENPSRIVVVRNPCSDTNFWILCMAALDAAGAASTLSALKVSICYPASVC
jgi:hypothetical protein